MNRALPRTYPSALESFDVHLDAIREQVRRLLDGYETKCRIEIELMKRIDALETALAAAREVTARGGR